MYIITEFILVLFLKQNNNETWIKVSNIYKQSISSCQVDREKNILNK